MRIALAQLSASPDRALNLERALESMDRAAGEGAQLIAFPELAVDQFFPQYENANEAALAAEPIPGPTSDLIAEKAREHGLVTVFNIREILACTYTRRAPPPGTSTTSRTRTCFWSRCR